jgi:hypothetical protein
VGTVAVTLLATTLLYVAVRGAEEREALATLKTYSVERAARENARFARIAAAHRAAGKAYEVALDDAMRSDPAVVGALFDRLFPLAADGTRRSAPEVFDGLAVGPGDRAQGIGAFLANGAQIGAVERAQLLAAFQVVRRFGEGASADLDNFYFFTPSNRLLMYAPNRRDRLDFYRRTAPPGFSFAFEELVQITLPANNPDGVMRCTKLQPVIYDRAGTTWTTGCMTPVYHRGSFLGAWGTSLLLDKVLDDSLEPGLPGFEHLIITPDRQLIASPRLTEQGSSRTRRFLQIDRSGDGRLKRLADFSTSVKRGNAVTYLPDDDIYVAVATLPEPGWHFVSVSPAGEVRASAFRAAAITLGIGLLLSIGLTLLMRSVIRREVVVPLRHLIRTLRRALKGRENRRDDSALMQLPTGRTDEIGLLARGFRYLVETSVPERRRTAQPWFGPERRKIDD